jgi:hypothetical protein
MQDPLIPNTVFILPLLKQISDLDGPIQVETLELGEDNIRVRSHDDIRVPVEGVPEERCRITVELDGEITDFEVSNDRHLSPFHEAWITGSLLQSLARNGHKVTLRLEQKDDGFVHTSLGVDQGVGPSSSTPTAYLMAELYLNFAQSVKRRRDKRGLSSVVQDRIFEIRRQKELEAADRHRREQEADLAGML